jgi:hypothetical protein
VRVSAGGSRLRPAAFRQRPTLPQARSGGERPRGLPHPREPPKREWGLASLPAPTVRGPERQAGEGEAPFLGEGSGRGLAAPVGSLLAFLRSRSFSGPPGWPVKRTSRVPLDHRQANLPDLRKIFGRTREIFLRSIDEANSDDLPFASPSTEVSGNAGHLWKVGSAPACAFTSRFFVKVPGQSLLRHSFLRRSAASAVATSGVQNFRFRKNRSTGCRDTMPGRSESAKLNPPVDN